MLNGESKKIAKPISFNSSSFAPSAGCPASVARYFSSSMELSSGADFNDAFANLSSQLLHRKVVNVSAKLGVTIYATDANSCNEQGVLSSLLTG